MQLEKVRFAAELIGISALVVSIAFVGYELKATRDMNLAQLDFNRLSVGHAKFLAAMESEPMLRAYAKRAQGIWQPDGLTELERGAELVNAAAQIEQWRIEFKFIDLGFQIRVWSLEEEISQAIRRNPAILAAWHTIWLRGEAPTPGVGGFYGLMTRLIADAGAVGSR